MNSPKSKILLLVICLPLIIATNAGAQTADTISQIDRLFARYHNEMPGVSVAIEREGKIIYNKEIALLRIEPGLLNNGNSSGYAAGLMIGKWNQYNEISHSGSTAGYRAWLAWYPEKKISVAILSNYASFDPVGVGRAITAIFLGPKAGTETAGTATGGTERTQRAEPIQLDPAQASEYSGTYYSEDADVTYTIEARASEVWVYRMAGDTFRLTPSLKDEFTNASNGTFKFTRDKKGKISGFSVSVSRALNVPFKKL